MMRLFGPVTVDELAPGRAARTLLDRFAADVSSLPESAGSAPGLYLLVEDEALRGFWVTLGEDWLEVGSVSGVVPPFAKALLEAATETLWWSRYPVRPLVLGAWRPLVVLEWPPALAERASMAPPGVPSAAPAAPPEAERAGGPRWLLAPESRASESLGGETPWARLPPARSVVCVLRGSLRWARSVHEGRFELVQLPAPDEGGAGIASLPRSWREQGYPLEEWVDVAAGQAQRPDGAHQLGFPIQLPGGRVGFPMTGWLSRDLELQPPRPSDAAVGQLVSRDTRNPILAQAAQAFSVTVLVLFGTLGFSGGLEWISRPRIDSAAPAIQPAAQPAFSVCSAEHGRFVDELSCQVSHLAGGGQPGSAACDGWRHEADLQAAWCGLRDRDLDGAEAPSGFPWADVAASQACFEVLDRPYEYALGGLGDPLANPHKLLEDPRLRVNALVELVARLDAGCETYRDRVSALVDGAILATHVGGGGDESQGLQQLAFDVAERGVPGPVRQCMEAGRQQPLEAASVFEGLCGPDGSELVLRDVVAWQALGGPAPRKRRAVVDRYADARFANGLPQTGRWACHARLSRGSAAGDAAGAWDLTVPVPGGYGEGGARTQLSLDAWLTVTRAEATAPEAVDVCWAEVDRMLATYSPVHPLLGVPASGGWPSDEQRICGQVCAVAYRLQPAPAATWATPGGDLAVCLDRGAPFDPRLGGIDGTFDRLALPWNQAREGGWTEPTAESLCAFHLLSQGQLPGVLPADLPAPAWSGQPIPGSRLAGGRDGAAADAADAMIRYGRSRSTATCSRVAAQCFTERLLAITGNPDSGPQLWRDDWRRDMDGLARASVDELSDTPWCRVLRPYLAEDGRLPEGELDFPCALGVAETRDRVESMLDGLVLGRSPTSAAGGKP